MSAHRITADTIKGLAMDAVQAADSGHPGMPMGAADMAVVLWRMFLRHDPSDPKWFDRDRFVLSAGHGSMLLYSLLHLSGYDVTLDDLRAFRQWGSRTPGHPEYGHTPGVETTTGPLGQGFATGVGMAIAERFLRDTFGPDLVDHWIYAIVSDGDLMEGLSSESASLAGHLALGHLVYLYDDNQISIDGATDLTFTEDVAKRFDAFRWHVQRVDGHDPEAIAAAIEEARADARPSLICCRTVIGQGSAKEGTSSTHGAPLGKDDVAATKVRLGLDPTQQFVVPDAAKTWLRGTGGADARKAWEQRVASHPRGEELRRWIAADGEDLVAATAWPGFEGVAKVATRKASQACLKALYGAAPFVIGGSADLAGSNGTEIGARKFTPASFEGAGTLCFGVREHAMAAAANGIALHGGAIPYVATFLMFHDYMRPSVRLSALMGVRVVYVYTHDSIFVGEDGPTHQPIETLLAMRATPNVHVFRPADATETVEAWKAALTRQDGPTAIVLTRQDLPVLDRGLYAPSSGAQRGAYVLADVDGTADVVLIATGSEVALALGAKDVLAGKGIAARVVSAPCLERFLKQDADYRASVLPAGIPKVSVEAGTTLGWERIVGDTGASVGIDHFGASAPANILAEKFGFTVANVVATAERVLAR